MWAAAVVAALALTTAAPAVALTEYPVPASPFPNSYPNGIVAGPDGALWFTERLAGPGRIGRITTGGALTEFPLPRLFSGPSGIAVGPDKALWFTEQVSRGNSVGRITTAGAITELAIPTPDSAPVGIAAGRDGALWFTESQCSVADLPELFCQGGKIGRITTGGVISEFPVPAFASGPGVSEGSAPWGIAAGPDGALWFTEQLAGRIGRITTKGKITEFKLRAKGGGSSPSGIVAGPDGALWFGETGRIGRITTEGELKQFRLPASDDDVTAITVGPDGALWFTEEFANKVGRMTTDGALTEFRLPANGVGPRGSVGPGGGYNPNGIVAGPDRALWFSEQFGDRIGRIPSPAPRVLLKLAPRSRCASNAVRARIKVTGGAKLSRLDLYLGKRRLLRTGTRTLRVRVPVATLRSGSYTLLAVAVDKARDRSTASATFRRC